MNEFYDALETRDPAAREAALFAALPAQVAHAQASSAAMAEILRGVDAAAVQSREALARLPVTRKSDLFERQRAACAAGCDPFGGFSAIGWRGLVRGAGAGAEAQRASRTSDVEQRAGRASDVEQRASRASDVEQRAGRASDVEQRASRASDVEQRANRASDVEQRASRASDVEQRANRASDVEQRASRALRVFQSPGPIYEPEGSGTDYWRMARAIFAAGFRAGELIHNSFSYHLTPAGAMMESGAHAIGCTVFAGGVGNTELQLQAIADLKPHGYIGTPSFLRILLEKAAESGVAIGSMTKAMVGGEAFAPSLRDWLAERGVAGYQSYATAELGLIAYETEARQGLLLDEAVIVEIVRPGTGDPVPEPKAGQAPEVGEVVVTSLNPAYPLVRFGTGDLSAVLPGMCPSGRTATRIRGWLGRADQTAKVRGMFVHPSQVAEIARRHPEVRRVRLVIEGEMANDRMTLRVEAERRPPGLPERIAETIRDVTKLRGDVELVAPGALANDGKVIEDARSYR